MLEACIKAKDYHYKIIATLYAIYKTKDIGAVGKPLWVLAWKASEEEL